MTAFAVFFSCFLGNILRKVVLLCLKILRLGYKYNKEKDTAKAKKGV